MRARLDLSQEGRVNRMAREILFKAKRIDNGEWVEGDLVHSVYSNNDICVGKHCCGVGMHQVDESTICQYTGLTDKNGNKIWENDVVNYKNESVGYDKNGIVKFGEYHSGFDGNANHIGIFIEWNSDCLRKDIGFWVKNRELEVIGNIFDNPELIGGGE
jgi:uncharacterized phage protein (TIGR01671 family)